MLICKFDFYAEQFRTKRQSNRKVPLFRVFAHKPRVEDKLPKAPRPTMTSSKRQFGVSFRFRTRLSSFDSPCGRRTKSPLPPDFRSEATITGTLLGMDQAPNSFCYWTWVGMCLCFVCNLKSKKGSLPSLPLGCEDRGPRWEAHYPGHSL